MVPPKKMWNSVSAQWCRGKKCGILFLIDGVSTEAAESCFWSMVHRGCCPDHVHGWSCLGKPCVCLPGEGFGHQRICAFTRFREWLCPNCINMGDGSGGCPVVWGAGRRCSRALRAPRRFAGNHLEWILLDLRCPLSLGWGSRQWSAFGREMGMCVGLASRNLVIRTSESEHQEPLRQTYQHA